MINCPYCGKLTDPNLDNCVHCGMFLKKGGGPGERKSESERQNCPSCGALVREGDIICVACGTNLLTMQKVAEEKPLPEAEERRLPVMLGIVAGAVLLLIAIVAGVLFMLQDPVKRAERLSAEDRLSEATSILTDYVASHEDDAEALYLLGKLKWAARDYPSAAEAFERSFEADPENRDAGLLSVLALAEASAGQSSERQLAALNAFAAEFPQDEDGLLLLGLALGAAGDTGREVEVLDALDAMAPQYPGLRKALGVALAREDKYERAVSELETGLVVNPGDGEAASILAMVHALRGDAAEAVKSCEDAKAAGTPLAEETLTQAGLLLAAEGQYAEAETILSEAMGGANPLPAARFFHAVCMQVQGSNQAALREFNSLSSERDNPFAGRAALQAAEIQLALGDPGRARDALNLAAREEERHVAPMNTLRARVDAQEGDYLSARQDLTKAIAADPSYAPARLESGLLYVQEQDLSRGIRELERYLELADPADAGGRVLEVTAFLDQLKKCMQLESAPVEVTTSRAGGDR